MNNKKLIKKSKYLSLILRHKPEVIGLVLDDEGWIDVRSLIEASEKQGAHPINRAELEEIVKTDNKQRYRFSDCGRKIRANQGHSIEVELSLEPVVPPAVLYHGTATRFLGQILAEGLKPMNRQYVHLSRDVATATQVGNRHGKLVMLEIDTEAMQGDGYVFYLSDNHVWLSDAIPAIYIRATSPS